MRDYRFRGKRKDGEWVYSNGVWFDGHNTWLFMPNEHGSMAVAAIKPIMVDPSTIGQFTGWKDATAKEAYEHDIVKDGKGKIYVIRCSGGTGNQPNGYGGFYDFGCFHKDEDGYWCHAKHTYFSGMVVIGNIHDNPERDLRE